MKFRLGNETHDAQLRAMVAAEPMPGWVRLRFMREPSFFDGVAPQGHTNQVIVLLDGDEVVGMGCRSVRTVFIDGTPREFGYLSGLRSQPRVRLGTLLGRGYRFLRDLHEDDHVPGYLTTIVEHNRTAIDMLTSGRAGLPAYLPWGRCHSYAIPVRRQRTSRSTCGSGIQIRSATELPRHMLFDFLSREGSRRQFFPVLRQDLLGSPPYPGVALDRFRVALRQGRIVAAVAIWDQRACRQTEVAGYAPLLQALRPLFNVPCRLAGYPLLPRPGEALNMAYLAFPCVRENDVEAFASLLHAVRTQCGESDLHMLCLGLHENDPLNAAAMKFRHFRFDSRVFVTCWDDTRTECAAMLNKRAPHVEIAML